MVTNGHRHDYRIFAGNSNRPLAEAICRDLDKPLSKADVGRFSDGETQVEIAENVRAPTPSSSSPPRPTPTRT